MLVGVGPDDIDGEFMEELLSSVHGRSCGTPGSILHDEDLRLLAREFVHKNAYKRGQPNMTLNDFRNWVEMSYNVHISIETGRAWLHNLDFLLSVSAPLKKNSVFGEFF